MGKLFPKIRDVRNATTKNLQRSPMADADKNGGHALEHVMSLSNTVAVLRHGQSMANVAGLICSNPNVACTQYGLSATGQEQAKAAGLQIVDWYCQANSRINDGTERLLPALVILSSDFLRAKETAHIVLQAIRYHNNEIISRRLGVNKGGCDEESRIIPIYQNDVIYDLRLRERWFGDCDGTADQNYAPVWAQDAKDASLEPLGAESVHSVRRRVTDCVVEWNDRLEKEQSDPCLIVLVAHGDVLQILQTAFEKIPGTMHRTIPHLDTATLRVLQLQSGP
jgi:glucosyl-3-phosphoglycerate phosphatase